MDRKTQAPSKERILQEFAPIGKYRVRLVQNPRKAGAEPVLDIREYLSTESFEGLCCD